ncbi:MAG TPA: NUDIX domain-containing protein [Pseudomonadales bacterium]|nr:NUDIX domain-containing protein [Pseudomonadales bacterium]
MDKHTRYQGAIVRDHQLLLLQQAQLSTGQSYWVLPGGRPEPGETEAQCVQREMLEETGLRVEVGELLLDEQITWGTIKRRKTYLCLAPSGMPKPGYEPESAYASDFRFTAVQWIDLRSPIGWSEDVVSDPNKREMLQRIRTALGYV